MKSSWHSLSPIKENFEVQISFIVFHVEATKLTLPHKVGEHFPLPLPHITHSCNFPWIGMCVWVPGGWEREELLQLTSMSHSQLLGDWISHICDWNYTHHACQHCDHSWDAWQGMGYHPWQNNQLQHTGSWIDDIYSVSHVWACCSMGIYHDNPLFGTCKGALGTLLLSLKPSTLYFQAHVGMWGNSCAL